MLERAFFVGERPAAFVRSVTAPRARSPRDNLPHVEIVASIVLAIR